MPESTSPFALACQGPIFDDRPLMRFLLRVGLTAVLVGSSVGCAVKDPLYCQTSADCQDLARPVCDVHGDFASSNHIADTCIPRPDNCPVEVCGCTPGAFLGCAAAVAQSCGPDGMSMATTSCDSGCSTAASGCECMPGDSVCAAGAVATCGANGVPSAPAACTLGCSAGGKRCTDVSATNGLNQALDASVARQDVVMSDGATFDTSTGSVVDGDGSARALPSLLVVQSGGLPIRAFVVKSMVLGNSTIRGTNGFAIVADGEIKVVGRVSVRAASLAPAAGASQVSGCIGTDAQAGTSQFGEYWFGAGGGGGALAGGAGGEAHVSGTGLPGGSATGTADIQPLAGGCRGGNLLHPDGSVATHGGAGGGAMQLVSRVSIQVVRDGTDIGILDVGALGGDGDAAGGGSGGAILLEAPVVVVDGGGVGLFANGGGGGGGACGLRGGDGLVTGQAATGATCGANTAGGDGGTGTSGATHGANGTCTSFCSLEDHLGGGGGAVGRVRINTLTGTFAATGGAAISASSSVGSLGTR
jgi:hypothetical protein